MEEKPKNILDIDVNSPELYDEVQTEIGSDMARMKKCVEIILNLRMEAAELEVEIAALYHSELWYDMLDIQNNSPELTADEEYSRDDETVTQTT